MNTSDELRMRLPALAAQMYEAIDVALAKIRQASRLADHTAGDVGLAWKKGLEDSLKLLRPAQDAHDQFEKWMKDVLDQEVDQCGLTAEERDALFGGCRAGKK
jgi:hypothetical protein